jgi:predicted ArsR family transcriptional regulator
LARKEILDTPRTQRTNPPTVTDDQILEALPGTTPDLARVVGLSVSGVYQRLRRLQAEGKVYKAVVVGPTVWVRCGETL